MGVDAAIVFQRDERVVISSRAALVPDLGVHRAGRAEQLDGLVDQVATQVEQDATTVHRG